MSLLDMINSDPNSYLCRTLRHVQREVDEKLSDDDVQIILDFEEEQHRLGNFEKIFPCINNARHFGQFFEFPRGANNLLLKYLSVINPKQNEHHVCFIPSTDAFIEERTPNKFQKAKH